MRQEYDIVERIAAGESVRVDPVGTNYQTACRQMMEIFHHHADAMGPVVVALITRIQEQDKQIEMFEYTQNWRKRRP